MADVFVAQLGNAFIYCSCFRFYVLRGLWLYSNMPDCLCLALPSLCLVYDYINQWTTWVTDRKQVPSLRVY